jgi:hypothetical protein
MEELINATSMRVLTWRMPLKIQKIYRGTKGFHTSLAVVGPLTSRLEDERS